MKKLLFVCALFATSLSFGQEYEINANSPVSISEECHELVMATVQAGDQDGFASLRGKCFEVVGDRGNGLSGVRVIKVDTYLTYSKFYIKGAPTQIVYILNDHVTKIK